MAGLLFILNIAELTACITGFVFLKKLKNSFLRYFPFYLAFIVLSEIIGWCLKLLDMKIMNKAFYNYLVIPAEFLFFFWIFSRSLNSKGRGGLPLACAAIYLLIWLTDILYFGNRQFWFYSFSYTIGNLLMLVLIFRFFIQLVTGNQILHFKSNMMFWICSGLLLFYLGTFPYFGLLNTLAANYPELHNSYRSLVLALNILMYLMFTFSFIWGKPNTKYSSS